MFQSKSIFLLFLSLVALAGIIGCPPPTPEGTRLTQEAIQQQEVGQYREAIEYAEAALKHYHQEQNAAPSDWVRVFCALALSHEKLGNLDSAGTYYRIAVEVNGISQAELSLIFTRLKQLILTQQKAAKYQNVLQIGYIALKIFGQLNDITPSDSVNILYSIGFSNEALGKLDSALTYYERAKDVGGIDQTVLAAVLERLGALQSRRGEQQRATELYQQSLDAMESNYGVDHFTTQAQRKALANHLIRIRDYRGAAQVYEKLLQFHRQAPIIDSLKIAFDIQELASIKFLEGDYAKVEALLQEALQIYSFILGENDLLMAPILNDLAMTFERRGEYLIAQRLYRQLISVLNQNVGESHPDVGTAMHALGLLEQKMGWYSSADSLITKALQIKKYALGDEHLDVATLLYDKANLDGRIGKYEQAEDSYKAIFPLLSDTHPILSELGQNLGNLFVRTGRFDEAKIAYLQALTIKKQTGKPFYPDIATIMNDLAKLYTNHGLFNEAESLYCFLVQTAIDTLGINHSETVATMDDLAAMYFLASRYSKADSLYNKVLAIREQKFGLSDPGVATTLTQLARIHRTIGEFPAADSFSIRAENIRRTNQLTILGRKAGQKGDFLKMVERSIPDARSEADQVFSIYRVMLPKYTAAQQENIFRKYPPISQYWPSLCVSEKSRSQSVVSFTYYLTLNGKRLIFEALANQHSKRRTFERISAIRDSISAITEFISNLATSPIMNHATEIRRKTIVDSIRSEQRFLENKQIALEHLDEFRRETISNEQIIEALPDDGVLVDFLFFTQSGSNMNVSRPPKSYYLAFILQKDSAVTMVKLGDVQLIHESIDQLRESVGSQLRTNVVPIGTETNQTATKQICHNLWMQLFKPLIPALGTKKRIFINPDGKLNLISFNIFIDDSSRFLIEKYQIHNLANTRDLLLWNHIPKIRSRNAVLIADPDFEMNLSTNFPLDTSKTRFTPKDTSNFFVKNSEKFVPLPFTRVEAMKIDTLLRSRGFKTSLLLGSDARESNLKRVASPGALHIATHGFFAPDSTSLRDTTDFILGENGGLTNYRENSLLRCGLALSGANRIPKGMIGENGKATADELVAMDLTATDLVVLSACLTGYGEETVEHEGVHGLFRSFLLAGAKTVLASLWEVSDYETKSLMIEFYQNYLNGSNPSKSEALRQAQLSMIERLRKQNSFADPELWGAFISIGEP